ncbi:MAG: hypothetical protein QM441_07570, partial [Synergistota bacterium]|nr:hypothetical protein [Synergistota bacterium]
MRVGRVLNKLTEKGLYYQFAGSPEQEVTMVQKIEGCNKLGEGMLSCESMLYVCEKDHRSYVEQTPDKVLPCVIAKDSTDCRRILHIANKILLEKYCEEMNLLSLYKNIAERTSPAVAICLCETVMGNP